MPDAMPRDIPHDTGFVEVADRCWVARFAWFDVNVGVVGGDARACWSSTPTPPRPRAARSLRLRAPARRRRGRRGRQHPRALRPHLRQRRLRRGVRRACRSTPTRRPPSPRRRAGPSAAASCPTTSPTTRSRADVAGDPDRAADRDVLLGPRRRPRRPAWSSWCTPAAATPAATSSCGSATPTWCSPATWSRSRRCGTRCRATATTATRWSGRPPSTWCSACSTPGSVVVPGHGAPGRQGLRARSSAARSAWSPRRSATSRRRGVPVRDALAATEWPYPREELAHAVRRGYEHLPRTSKTLPLI